MKRRLQVLAVCAGLMYYGQILVFLRQPTPNQIGDALIWAVNNRSISFLDRIFASGVSVDHKCSYDERPNGLEILWRRTLNTDNWCGNLRHFHGNTPLMLACHPSELTVAKYLLARGADPSATDDNGCTALHDAAWQGNEELVRLLIRHGANVNAADDFGRTPLHMAVGDEDEGMVTLLIRNGANLHAADREGETPLDYRRTYRTPKFTRFLQELEEGRSEAS